MYKLNERFDIEQANSEIKNILIKTPIKEHRQNQRERDRDREREWNVI
jgi:hypothetical protein